jgi:uncharacterized protein (TIGR02231 family)
MAVDNKNVVSKIKEATVFFQGAELIHTANAVLQKGANEISISGLSPNIDRNSIKIKTTGGVLISAFEFSMDYLTEKNLSPNAQKIQDAVKEQQKLLEQVKSEILINSEMHTILGTSIKNASASEKGLTMDELMKMMDYYKSKASELTKLIAAGKEKEAEISKRLKELISQLEQETNSNKASGILKLNLTSPTDGKCDFTISYYTTSAGWTPYYDINVADANKPIKIISKAKVRQVTGIEWEKVKITLSSAAPSSGKVAPLFNTWFLRYKYDTQRQLQNRAAGIQNSYSYAKKEIRSEEALIANDMEYIEDEPG